MSSIKAFFAEKGIGVIEKDRRIIVEVASDRLKDIINEIWTRYNNKAYLATITGIDYIDENVFELDYEIWFFDEKTLLVIKTKIPRNDPVIDSITDIIPGAIPYEQEIYDLLGIKFQKNKYLVKGFFVPKNILDSYPLRKDWQGEKR